MIMSRYHLLFLTALAVPLVLAHVPESENSDPHFDYLLLATQWPETFCQHQHCVQHPERWLIHGAWPENNDGTWPQFCDTKHQHPYRHDLLKPILSELQNNWRTLKSGSSDDDFWKHEYEKHGTCAIDSPLMPDELHYFQSTLAAFKRLHIEQWLSAAGITPSNSKTYSLADIHHAIEKGLGHRAQIECSKSSSSAQSISQINFCLNKLNLAPFDCKLPDHNCNNAHPVSYPAKK